MPSPVPQPWAGNSAAGGLATVKGMLANLTTTTRLLYGGLVVALFGTFCPWVEVTLMGVTSHTSDQGPQVDFKYLALLVIAAAAWLAWPAVAVPGSTLAANRRLGLTAAVGVLAVVFVIAFVHIESYVSDLARGIGGSGAIGQEVAQTAHKLFDVHPGWGMYLYAVGVIVAAVGVVRIWMHRSKAM